MGPGANQRGRLGVLVCCGSLSSRALGGMGARFWISAEPRDCLRVRSCKNRPTLDLLTAMMAAVVEFEARAFVNLSSTACAVAVSSHDCVSTDSD